MKIADEFLEKVEQIESKKLEEAHKYLKSHNWRDPPKDCKRLHISAVEEALKSGGFGIFKIHKYPDEKPKKEGTYIVTLKDKETCELIFFDGGFFPYVPKRENDVVSWLEFD